MSILQLYHNGQRHVEGRKKEQFWHCIIAVQEMLDGTYLKKQKPMQHDKDIDRTVFA